MGLTLISKKAETSWRKTKGEMRRRKWNRKCRGGGQRLSPQTVEPHPPESHSLPLAPPSSHCSSPLLPCLFSPLCFFLIPYTWFPLTPSLKELFHPPLSPIYLFPTGGQPTPQNTPCLHSPSTVRTTMPLLCKKMNCWKLVGANLSLR